MENHERTRPVGQKQTSDWSRVAGNEPSRKSGLGGMESGKSERDQRSEGNESEEIKYPSRPGSSF